MNKRILNDERAVSGLVGEIMLIGIVILAIGLITVSTYSYLNKDPDPPHIEVNGLANLAENEIHLKHQGGESIEGRNLRVLVNVNGTTLPVFDENDPNRWGIRLKGQTAVEHNFDRWTLGDILVLKTFPATPQLTEDSDIRVTIVHRPSNRVVVSGEVFGGLFGDALINIAPIADAGDDQTNGLCENTTWAEVWVYFNGSDSHDPDNPTGGICQGIVSWQWDFDDGNESDVLGVPLISHNYSANGTYDVELTVTDDDGETDTDTCRITINPPEPRTANAGPEQWVGVGATVQFDGSGSTGCIKEWQWDFGDGTKATVNTSTTTHTYTNTTSQNYTVNLTVVEDHSNKTANATAIIHVVANGFMIVNPDDGDTVSGNVTIEAHVIGMEDTDHTNFSIRSVSSETDYSWDKTNCSGKTVASNTTSYSYNWDTGSLYCGNYTINATAYNTGGSGMGTDQITVCVCNVPGLVGFWRFDDGTGSATANDSSCNKNHGTIVGNLTGVIDGAVYAYQFDGSGDDYVEVANSTSLAMTDETTVDAWVNSSDAGEQYILAKGDMAFESRGVVIEGGNEIVGQNTSIIGWPAFGVGYKRAQTFELAGDATLHGVKIELKKSLDWESNPVTGDIKASICTDGGTQPGIEIASATIHDSDVSTADYGWIDATFNCSLMGETIYWLMLESPDGTNGGWSYYWNADNTDPYSGGEAQYYDDGVGSWVNGYESVDMTFQLNITTEPYEGPASTYTDRISMPDPDNFKYLVYAGNLGFEGLTLNWSESGLEMVMVNDGDEVEIGKVQAAGVKVYYYIALGHSYAEFANKTDWEQNVTDEMDAHNYTDGFIWDELDSGYYGGEACRPDFNERLDRLNDHAHDNLGVKTVANGVRYYANHCGSDYYMWESFMSTYNGTNASTMDYYYYWDFFNTTGMGGDANISTNGIKKYGYLRDNGVLNKTLVHSYGEHDDDAKSIYDYIASRVLGMKGFSYADATNFGNGTTAPLTRLAEGLKWDLGTRMSYDVDESAGTLSGRFTNGYVTDYVNWSFSHNSTNYTTDLISDPLTAHWLNSSSRVTGLDFCLIRGQVDFMHGVLRSSSDLTDDPDYHVLSATLDAASGTATLHIDGTLAAERTFHSLPFDFSDQNLTIGTDHTGTAHGFSGTIDDIMIYNCTS